MGEFVGGNSKTQFDKLLSISLKLPLCNLNKTSIALFVCGDTGLDSPIFRLLILFSNIFFVSSRVNAETSKAGIKNTCLTLGCNETNLGKNLFPTKKKITS